MAANQGIGKYRYRLLRKTIKEIISFVYKKPTFYTDITQIKEELYIVIEEYNDFNINYYTPNWETLWLPRIYGYIDEEMEKLLERFPELEYIPEDDEEPEEREQPEEDDREEPENCGNNEIFEGILLLDDCNEDAIRQVAQRRNNGLFYDEIEGYIVLFRHLVIAIEEKNGLYYLWVTDST